MSDPSEFLTKAEAAKLFRVSTKTLDSFPGLPRIKIGRRVLFQKSALVAYAAARAAQKCSKNARHAA
jgi:hypothetical protein